MNPINNPCAAPSRKFSDSALDAGIAAWFGVTKVEAEKNFIRTRMQAAVHAVITADHNKPSTYVNGAGILASDTPAAVVKKLDAAYESRMAAAGEAQ